MWTLHYALDVSSVDKYGVDKIGIEEDASDNLHGLWILAASERSLLIRMVVTFAE